MSPTVTAQRRKESPELGDSILSLLRGLVARATEGDLEAIEQLRRVEQEAGQLVGYAVAGARAEAGYSWAQLAPALGTTRQSANERFKDVQALPILRTSCGRVTFSEAGKYLHERKCRDCGKAAELGA